jgi:hypothetical protein
MNLPTLTAEEIYSAAATAGARPDPLLTISQWADKYRTLSQRASAEPGPWRTDRTPYLREIMDCLSPASPIERTVFMKGAQIGGTECGNNWIGYPANTLVISEPVWLKLVDHPDLVDRVKYGQTNGGPSRITREALAAILEIDRILVMGSIENTAGEGAAASHSFIGGKNALLCNVATNPGLLTPSAAYTFGWTGYLGAGRRGGLSASAIIRFCDAG